MTVPTQSVRLLVVTKVLVTDEGLLNCGSGLQRFTRAVTSVFGSPFIYLVKLESGT